LLPLRECLSWICTRLLTAALLCSPFAADGQNRTIHLRTETIRTESRTNAAALAPARDMASQASASGLFLLQLENTVTPDRQAELRTLGVELLHYVPDDAFITRFNQVPLDKVRALSFVRWVGAYRPDHKLHPRLAALASAVPQTNQLVTVNVLIAPQTPSASLKQVRSLFSSVLHESQLRRGTIVRGSLPPGRLDALAQSSDVLWIERAPKRRLVDEAASKLVGGDDGFTATPTVTQQMGFDGSGVTVCVADTGLDSGDTNAMHPDLEGRVTGFKWYGASPDGTPLTDGSDGYGHGTHCAGIVAGNAATGETDPDFGQLYGLGVAPGANLFIERLFDDAANEVVPPPDDATMARDAVQNGAVIGSNSWGNDVQGEYDLDAFTFDEMVRSVSAVPTTEEPFILVFAAGNAGPDDQTVDSPASAKNVMAIGACENVPGTLALTYGLYADGEDSMADFSSRGPCEDGRIKPDVVAPGTWIASAASSYALDEAAIAWTPIDYYYVYMGGTSMACPHAAGAAAVFVQYYKSLHTNAIPSPALVKAALINSANELDELNGGPGPIPNNDEGWGRITLTNIIVTNFLAAPRYYEYVDQTTLLTNGQIFTHHTLVQNSDQPLKITLAYTDAAAFPGALPALVNDLDLEVIGPDGTLYRGNQFAGYDSVPNAPSPDTLNNVEAVHLSEPSPGDYVVRVRARHVVEDVHLNTAAIEQDFALVVSGDLARPGGATVLMDRPSYTAPSQIQLSVFDLARAASNTVSVALKSTTEPSGETYILHAAGNYGAFTGAVATVSGGAAVDGKLEIHTADAIEADYLDSHGVKRVATAVADLVPPVITSVAATVDLGVLTITWQTSEPANSIVRYSTNLTFNLAVTNTALVTSHVVRLTRLIPGQTYFFYVGSSDGAGNLITNNNSGAYFSFVGIASPTVLLVDAYDPVDFSPEIPDGTYTNALAAAGFSFAHWKVSARGGPELGDLEAFPVVLWRVVDDIVNYGYDADGVPIPDATNNTLSAQQQVMIEDYLNAGGSFCISSLGILSQLRNVPFRKNVLQVAGFKVNPDAPLPCGDCDEYFGVPAIVGGTDPLTSGMSITLDYSNYPSFDDGFGDIFGPDFSDTFTPSKNATATVFESVSGKPCGMCYPPVGVNSPGRVVFLSFPFDTIPFSGSAPNNQVVFLRNILNFLVPGAKGVGTVNLDHAIYSIPDQITIEVGDSDLEGTGQTQATCSTSSSTNRVTITLRETTHPGLFRGYLTVVTTNAAANQLAVKNKDTFTVSYFDTSNHSNIVATAAIDSVPPTISQVSATALFGDATVTWTTSKPADSLVKYGESVLLGRTAYAGQLVTNHSVSISSLSANRDYFYQVTSRDAAGNTTSDTNLYTFSTKAAPRPPWSDDLESGATGWSVVPDPSGTVMNWSLGTPNNGLQSAANGGTNAWGSNLNGESLGLFETESSFLYSPPIDLSGLSSATLTFWHCFDFSSPFNLAAQMGISTDPHTPPASIPTLADYGGKTSYAWVQATNNLTAYVGKTIQVVWYYAAFGDGSGPLDGWLLDDVRITGVSAGASGTITITKNLGQGRWTLNGPISQTGTAPSATITNAPPGPYTVQFSDVTFYQTPLAQSNNLATSGTLNFTGNYGFLDLNRNGISDAWEKYFFDAVATNRTQSIDSDGDGMPDYAEFIAGTNPTNAESRLIFLGANLLTNHLVQLEWAAIPGRLYQVQSSALAPPQGRPRLSGSMNTLTGNFTLHVDAPTNVPYVIQVSSNLNVWAASYTNLAGGYRDWIDPAGGQSARRFYRTVVLPAGTTNLQGWTPVTEWLQASSSPMYYTTPSTNQGVHAYRIQVRP
jgi:serine protease AprX